MDLGSWLYQQMGASGWWHSSKDLKLVHLYIYRKKEYVQALAGATISAPMTHIASITMGDNLPKTLLNAGNNKGTLDLKH